MEERWQQVDIRCGQYSAQGKTEAAGGNLGRETKISRETRGSSDPLLADAHRFGVITAVIAVADVAVLIPASRRGFDIARAINIARTIDIARAVVGEGASNQTADDTCSNAACDNAAGIVM